MQSQSKSSDFHTAYGRKFTVKVGKAGNDDVVYEGHNFEKALTVMLEQKASGNLTVRLDWKPDDEEGNPASCVVLDSRDKLHSTRLYRPGQNSGGVEHG